MGAVIDGAGSTDLISASAAIFIWSSLWLSLRSADERPLLTLARHDGSKPSFDIQNQLFAVGNELGDWAL